MNKLVLFFFALSLSTLAFCQNDSLVNDIPSNSVKNQRHLISFNLPLAYPGNRNSTYFNSDKEKGYRNYIDAGFGFGYTHRSSTKFMVGVEYEARSFIKNRYSLKVES